MLTWMFLTFCVTANGKSLEDICPRNEGLFYATSPDCLIYYRCQHQIQQTGTCFPWQRFDIHSLTCKQRNEVDCNPEYADVWKPVYGNPEDLSMQGEDLLIGETPLTGQLPGIGGIDGSAGSGGIPGLGGVGTTPGVGGTGDMSGLGGAGVVPGEEGPGGTGIKPGIDMSGGMPAYIPGIGGAGSLTGTGGSGSLQGLGGIPGFGGVPSVGWVPVRGGIPWIGGDVPESGDIPEIGVTERIPETGEIGRVPGLGAIPETGWIPGLGAIPGIEGTGGTEGGPGIGVTGGIPGTAGMPGLVRDRWIPGKAGITGFINIPGVGIVPTVGGIIHSGNIAGIERLPETKGTNKIPISAFLVKGTEMKEDKPMFGNEFLVQKEQMAEKDTPTNELDNGENWAPGNEEIGDISLEESRDKIQDDKSSEEINSEIEIDDLKTWGEISGTENLIIKDQSFIDQNKVKKHKEIMDKVSLIFKIRESNKNNVKYDYKEGFNKIRKSTLAQKSSSYDFNKLTWENFVILNAFNINKQYTPEEVFEHEQNNLYSETNGDGTVNVRKRRQQDSPEGSWYWCGSGRFVFVQNNADGSQVCLQLQDPEFINREGNGSQSGDMAGHTFLGSPMFNG